MLRQKLLDDVVNKLPSLIPEGVIVSRSDCPNVALIDYPALEAMFKDTTFQTNMTDMIVSTLFENNMAVYLPTKVGKDAMTREDLLKAFQTFPSYGFPGMKTTLVDAFNQQQQNIPDCKSKTSSLTDQTLQFAKDTFIKTWYQDIKNSINSRSTVQSKVTPKGGTSKGETSCILWILIVAVIVGLVVWWIFREKKPHY